MEEHQKEETLEEVYDVYAGEELLPRKKEFKRMVDKGYSALKKKAREGETITYDEFEERIETNGYKDISYVLDGIKRIDHLEGRPLLPVFAVDKHRGTPGGYFYDFLQDRGWLEENGYSRPLSKTDREEIAEKIRIDASRHIKLSG
jgi:hypothetical protein